MEIGVVLPQTESAPTSARSRAYARAGRGLGYRARPGVRPRAGRRPEPSPRVERSLRHRHHVPRAARALRLPRGHHRARAGHRRDHPAAAADGARGQAGGGGGPAHRRPASGSASASAGTRRVRGARRGLHRPRAPDRGAGHAPASAVDRASGHLRRRVRPVTGAGWRRCRIQRPIPLWFGGSRPRRTSGSAGSPTAGSRRC